ncbi:MAG: PEP-CTERM sorting domain-containing protein [Pseudomonadota bacterium]
MHNLTRLAMGLASLTVVLGAGPANAAAIKFTAISTAFPSPIGIDHYEPTNEVVMSVNYPSGLPHNFRKVAADGTQAVFAPSVSGFTDEVKIATVRSGNVGGFTTGDLFVGNGVDGEIARVTAGGATVINPFVSFAGSGNGLMRGSLHVDRTGAWGGDLLAVTTAGELWRVTSAGVSTKIADVGVHLEGLSTVPLDSTKYGPLAGKAIAGAEGSGLLYAFDTAGGFVTYDVDVNIEDIDMINANENFYGVNFGTSKLLGAEAAQFAPYVGDILLTQEFSGASGLFRLYWNGSALVSEAFTVGAGSAPVGQWEHVTFSPAGIVEIPSVVTGVPEPMTLSLLGAGLFGIGALRRRRA